MHYPKPFYITAKRRWAVDLRGPDGKRDRHFLTAPGPKQETEAAAWTNYHTLMATQGAEVAADPDTPLWLAIDLFLADKQGEVESDSLEQYRFKLTDFCAALGPIRVADLTVEHVTAWVKTHDWAPATQRGALTYVRTLLNWCVRRRIVAFNPILDLKRPPPVHRDRTLAPSERTLIRSEFGDCFGDFLDALTWAGCRPGDIMALEAKHLDFERAFASLPGKTTRATQRLIEFPLIPPLLALCQRLVAEHPEGPIFRNSQGRPWTRNAVRCRMRRLRARVQRRAPEKSPQKPLTGVTAYTYRHSFGTDAVERGVPLPELAALMNHSDLRTTMGYVHVRKRRAHLHQQALKAHGLDPSGPGGLADESRDVGLGVGGGDPQPGQRPEQ